MKKTFCLIPLIFSLFSCQEENDNNGTNDLLASDNCSQTAQNDAFWQYMNDWYLWNDSLVQTTKPEEFSSINDLLTEIKAQTPDDRFSYVESEQSYQDRVVNATYAGLGFKQQFTINDTEIAIILVYQDSAADNAGLKRGDRITHLNGVAVSDLTDDDGRLLSTVFGEDGVGVSLPITWRNTAGEVFTETLIKAKVETNTVMATDIIETSIGKVGYLVFDSFIPRAVDDLNTAFDAFSQAEVSELVLDLRTNSGGSIDIANQLASQIAGENVLNPVQNFLSYEYNANHSNNNKTWVFKKGDGSKQLDLTRLIVLSSSSTCSASEMLVNSLSPFIEVKVVGGQSCGKPVGMNADVRICDTRLFAINFQTKNSDGFGDYFDGLPVDCAAEDTINSDWGSLDDPLLKEGLYLLENGSCSAESEELSYKLNNVKAIKANNLDSPFTKGQ